jgi:hypothetical protein
LEDDPAARSVNVDEVNVALAMARLNVTETVVPVETPVAPAAGDWLTITGGAAVVKVHVAVLPKATPLVSVTVPATVTVYVVPAASADEGVSVAVAPETPIDAVTFDDAPAARNVKVEEVKVELFIARLKVTETLVPVETPVAPAAGDWLTITGAVAVVGVHVPRFCQPVVAPVESAAKPKSVQALVWFMRNVIGTFTLMVFPDPDTVTRFALIEHWLFCNTVAVPTVAPDQLVLASFRKLMLFGRSNSK